MADDILTAYSTIYAELAAVDPGSVVAPAGIDDDPLFRGRMKADGVGALPRLAPKDPGNFKKALDRLIPGVQAALKAATDATDYDEAEKIESVLSRLYLWRIFARDQLIAVIDSRGTDEAMAALRRASAALEETRDAFDQGDHDTGTAMTSLEELAEALGLKR
jgi:hypothetical protein